MRLPARLWTSIAAVGPARGAAWCALVVASTSAALGGATADPPVAMRIESFAVAPAHSPPAVVVLMNHGQTPYQGTLRLRAPEGWQLSPAEQEVSLAPGEAKRARFLVKRGTITEENSYPMEATLTGPGRPIIHQQNVMTAGAPYFRPTIDGQTDDWKDAIPATWTSGGRKTVISTYWNRRRFSLLVAVEEDTLTPFQEKPGSFDAVQVAVSPEDAKTGTSPDDEAARYEFLFVSAGSGAQGKCFKLVEPGMRLAEGQKPRRLAPLEYQDANVAVSRKGAVTYYECSIPFGLMRDKIRPSEGREFHLSVLVHDPGGTGIRDWGEAVGLPSCQRNRLAWSRWPGAQWGDQPPLDNKTKWGLCSSKY